MSIPVIRVSNVKISLGIEYQRILDVYVETRANCHGYMRVTMEVSESVSLSVAQQYNMSEITLADGDGTTIFKGVCNGFSLDNTDGYKRLTVEAYDNSWKLDKEPVTQSYQDSGKTLSAVVREATSKFSASVALEKDPGIAGFVHQQSETPWQFAVRMINEYGMQCYPSCTESKVTLYGGNKKRRIFEEAILERLVSSGRDLAEQRRQQSDDPTLASYQFDSKVYATHELRPYAGDTIGSNTVTESYIKVEDQELVNYVRIAKCADTKASYSASKAGSFTSGIVTGTVETIDGNNITVSLSTDAPGMSGGLISVPYESTISDTMYCMPDEKDTVFIYYDNTGMMVCLGSKRTSTDDDDFSAPTEKTLTYGDRMVRLEGPGVVISATKKKYKDGDDTSVNIEINDNDGITITSGEEIKFESGKTIILGTFEASELSDVQRTVNTAKAKLQASSVANNTLYMAQGGMDLGQQFLTAGKEELSRIGNHLKQNVIDNIPMMGTINAAKQLASKNQQQEAAEVEDEPAVQFETGVLTVYGINKVCFDVAGNQLIVDNDVFFNGKQFNWAGYTKGSHAMAIEEYKDWWSMALDCVQLALDIAGFIPGVGAIFDVVNAGISLARGDFVGAGLSLISAIPGIGDAAGAAKMAVKGAKAVSKFAKAASKIQKAFKVTKVILNAVGLVDGICTFSITSADVITDMIDGKFDWSNPNDLSRLIGLARTGTGIAKSTKQAIEDINGATTPHDNDPENPKKCQGNDSPTDTADTTTDPINLVTGSLLSEYCDLALENTLGQYEIKRYYESVYDNTAGILGNKWRFGFESSLIIQQDYVDAQLDDLHMEHFAYDNGLYRNTRNGDETYTLSKLNVGYMLFDKHHMIKYYYDELGRLVSTADIHGNMDKIEYAGNRVTDRVDKIILASGAWAKFKYDNGHLASVEDNAGRRVTYTYEGEFLTSVCLPNGGKMRYEYTPEGYMTRLTDLNGKCFSTNFYDRKGRVIRQELEGGEEYVAFYDDANHQNTFLTTSNGENLTYKYNQQKKITEIIHPDESKEIREYDASGNMILEIDREGRKTKRTYDNNGMIICEIDACGLEKRYEYNNQGLVTRYYESTGREYVNQYDEANNLLFTKVRIDEKTWRKTEYVHDSKGRLLSIKNADGSCEKYKYNGELGLPSSHKTISGNTIHFEYDKKGSLTAEADEFGRIEYSVNVMGHRTAIKDEEGNVTRYYYDNMENITKLIRPTGYNPTKDDGKGTEYHYDIWTFLTRVVSPEHEVSIFENDYLGNKIKEISPNQVGKESPKAFSYEYNIDRKPIKVTAPDGGVQYKEYDRVGNLICSMSPEEYKDYSENGNKKVGTRYEYDGMNRLTKITDAQGVVEAKYVYDTAGFLVKGMNAADYLSADTDEARTGSYYEYDYEGNVLSIRRPLSRDESGKVSYSLITFSYDIMGRCTAQKRYLDEQDRFSAKGRVNLISYSYDASGRVIRVTDSTGSVVEYEYNSRNQRIKEKTKINNDCWKETAYEYSPAGNIVRIAESADEDGCGRKYVSTKYFYDGNGNITKLVLPTGDEVLRTYDLCDRLVSECYKEKGGSINNTIKYSYDKNGNITCLTYQDGHTETISYDSLNRVISRKEGDNASTKYAYNLDGKLISRINPNENYMLGEKAVGMRYSYDYKGRLTDVRAQNGDLLYCAEYDRYGNTIVEGSGDGKVNIKYDLAGRRTGVYQKEKTIQEFSYDALGNMVGIVDGNGNATSYSTDLWGRVEKITMADGTIESYSYDLAGNVSSATDGNGNTVYYRYNRLNQLSERIDAAGKSESFTYDARGRMKEHCDRDNRVVSFSYNMLGSPTEIRSKDGESYSSYEYDAMGRLTAAIGGGMRYDYSYYADGRLKEKSASGRVLLSYEYDAEGNKTLQKDITGKRTSYEYDFLGRLVKVCDGEKNLAQYEYTATGAVSRKMIGDGIESTISYDEQLNIVSLITKAKEQILTQNVYAYDANGNQTRREGIEGITSYAYDVRNRLIEASYPSALGGDRERIAYDAVGNRLSRRTNSDMTVYSYDNCNRLIEMKREFKNSQSAAEIINYSYDKQGNMIAAGENSFSYDGLGRQTKAEVAGNCQINKYDGEGLRNELEENGTLVKFIFNNDREVVVEEDSKQKITRYIRGLGIIASDCEEAKNYYHYVSDEQGSTSHILTEDARILNTYAYDAFGNIISKQESVENRFCYNGEMLDPITQQYYLRARFYNPILGRFTQEDTYYGDGLNLYNYCKSNPIGYIDPSGHTVCPVLRKKYLDYREAHPEATASEAYKAVTGRDPLKGSTGSIHYGELDSLGRATGVDATITADMIGTGSPAKSSIKPAGFGGQKAGHARGHLLGNQLGGAGDDPRNLTTLFQNPVNHPVMSSVEASVRKAVENGEVVQYSVKPIYEGNNLISSGVTIKATGDKGFYIYQTILNRK